MLQKRRGQATIDALLATAEKLFARHGYDAVSTKQLAADAGITIGALYHHFPSKEALYLEVIKRVFSKISKLPSEILDSIDPPEQKLASMIAWFVGIIIKDKQFALLLQRELLDPTSTGAAELDIFKLPLDVFYSLVRQLVPSADSDKAMVSVLALSFGLSNLKGIYAIVPDLRKNLSTPEDIASHATRLLLHGLMSRA